MGESILTMRKGVKSPEWPKGQKFYFRLPGELDWKTAKVIKWECGILTFEQTCGQGFWHRYEPKDVEIRNIT